MQEVFGVAVDMLHSFFKNQFFKKNMKLENAKN